MKQQSIEEIKNQYPNEWVLLGVEESPLPMQSGTVLFHGKDYLELCYKSSEMSKEKLTTIFFTGVQNTNRKWLKATRLQETTKKI